MLKGISVLLYVKSKSGVDALGNPIYTEEPIQVDDVLVAPSSNSEIVDMMNIYGKRTEYTLGIPKGDTNEWENVTVEFFGQKFKTFGSVIQGQEELVPLRWHKKVMCGRYE